MSKNITVGDRVTIVPLDGGMPWHDFDGALHAHEDVSVYTKDDEVQVVAVPGTFHTLNVAVEDSNGHYFDVAADALRLVPTFAPGDRAVVESDIFNRPGGIGTHAEFGELDRPKVGDVVTIEGVCQTTGDYVLTSCYRISPEGLVPAPRFVPGDRVAVVSSPYVGSTRQAGAVGTVVAPVPGQMRGVASPDYHVDIDGDYYGAWGFNEAHLGAAHVEPVGFGTAMHEAAIAEAEAVEFSVGDRVLVGENYFGSDKYAGMTGTVAYPADAEGDYMVDFEDDGYDYFKPRELALVVEEPEVEAEEPVLVDELAEAFSIPVRFIAGVPAADYVARLEASLRAASIIAAQGGNVTGGGVRDLAAFLLGE